MDDPDPKDPLVGVIMGSDSDLRIIWEAAKILEKFGVTWEIGIRSAHRTPEKMFEYAKGAAKRGLKVIITAAGGAAALHGMVAGLTHLPVIGVPIKTEALNGMDSLLSTVQMPPDVPVGTMAINGARNAGLFAIRMLAMSDETLVEKLCEYQRNLEESVVKKDADLVRLGPAAYLDR